MSSTNQSTGISHATGDSKVPHGVQQAVPEKLERTLPDSVHDTSAAGVATTGDSNPSALTPDDAAEQRKMTGEASKAGVSHATGDSKVPQKVQEAVPKGLEKVLPNKIHDTSNKLA